MSGLVLITVLAWFMRSHECFWVSLVLLMVVFWGILVIFIHWTKSILGYCASSQLRFFSDFVFSCFCAAPSSSHFARVTNEISQHRIIAADGFDDR